jgi:glycosyltransferase involved in cell wall biosynthesis
MAPKVTFVVPCYKLAHLLPECVNSILAQTYRDFEILIMDDCSPDDTPQVARSFSGDPRVQHIRNDPNLGHLRNYNKGLKMARGEYVWLMSADDRLRSPHILERYVEVMEENPQVGYAFCPGMALENGRETRVLPYSRHGDKDAIFDGREFLLKLLKGNFVLAAAGMARKECYEKAGYFPLDIPYAGDWYIWLIFALYYDVAYFAEPMVDYRMHELTITTHFTQKEARVFTADGPSVLWRIKQAAERANHKAVARRCEEYIVDRYRYYMMSQIWKISPYTMTFEDYEESLHRNAVRQDEVARVGARVNARLADGYCLHREFDQALQFYKRALGQDFWMPNAWAKYVLLTLRLGGVSVRARESLASLRRMMTGASKTDPLSQAKQAGS